MLLLFTLGGYFIIPHYIHLCDVPCREYFVLIAEFFLYSSHIHRKMRNSRTVFILFCFVLKSKTPNSLLFGRKSCPDAPRLLGPGSEFGNTADVSNYIKRVCEYQVTSAFKLTETEHLVKFAYWSNSTTLKKKKKCC